MKEKKSLHSIAEFESRKHSSATFEQVFLKLGNVRKIIGHFKLTPCFWDGFGFAYHQSGKRFKTADIKFE